MGRGTQCQSVSATLMKRHLKGLINLEGTPDGAFRAVRRNDLEGAELGLRYHHGDGKVFDFFTS